MLHWKLLRDAHCFRILSHAVRIHKTIVSEIVTVYSFMCICPEYRQVYNIIVSFLIVCVWCLRSNVTIGCNFEYRSYKSYFSARLGHNVILHFFHHYNSLNRKRSITSNLIAFQGDPTTTTPRRLQPWFFCYLPCMYVNCKDGLQKSLYYIWFVHHSSKLHETISIFKIPCWRQS